MNDNSLLELLSLAVMAAGGAGAVIKFTLIQFERRLETRFSSIEKILGSYKEQADTHAEETRRLDRDITQLKLDLANNYVRREDWIRLSTTLEAKLDALASRIETIRLQTRSSNDEHPTRKS